MKVRKLLEALEEFDPEDDVHISYTKGDYWRTVVAPELQYVGYEPIKYSDYHQSTRIVALYDENGDPLPEGQEHDNMVVVLSA